MNKVIEFIQQPWPWWVSGPLIAYIMFSLLYFGKGFGLSTNFKTVCNILGADKFSDFFKFDWRDQIWNLVFVTGTIIGGFLAAHYLTPSQVVAISPSTIADLKAIGVANPGVSYEPEMFNAENVWSLRSMIFLLAGGFFVGFGTRYANGCTSGHAISGLSNLQKWSLVAVVGFFIGGLTMTHLIMPYLMKL